MKFEVGDDFSKILLKGIYRRKRPLREIAPPESLGNWRTSKYITEEIMALKFDTILDNIFVAIEYSVLL